MSTSRDSASSHGSKKPSRRSVGDFIIEKEIGKGSFAQVYQGWHHKTREIVAIKSVELERLNRKLKENLYGEIKILKTLRHPHIVALHDCVESSTHINLIMEYCELGDLSLFIKKRDKLSTHPATHDMARKYPCAPNSGLHEVVIRHFLKQLASALEFLRTNNYVHRDVKPQNLLLLPAQFLRDQRGLPVMEASQNSLIPVAGLASLPMLKLADFGFARVLPSTSLAETLCGSPLYMAPEILRYEKYDAKADLWSVGTVLYEMATGRPPFRARNHVELLRKIEAAEDVIRFPREVIISPELKSLIRALLKRTPVERLSFEGFFTHPVATTDIPGLVEDDVPRSPPKIDTEVGAGAVAKPPSPRIASLRQAGNDPAQEPRLSMSPRESRPRSPSGGSPGQARFPRRDEALQRPGSSARDEKEGLGIRRPGPPLHAASAPPKARVGEVPGRHNTVPDARAPEARKSSAGRRPSAEEEKAAQDVMFERDYVVVEKRHIEVNALADELAENEKLGHRGQSLPKTGQIVRRATQQGAPTSTTGAIPTPSSRTALISQGHASHDRRSSYDKSLSASPGSASSAISKAIQDASLRLFGFKVPPLRTGKGQSPPLYHPFPAYPTPTYAGLLGDGKGTQVADEDMGAAQTIEELATRSDCVYGFAEVKYKQLVPMAPSAEHGLGGADPNQIHTEEDGLTVEAIVSLSEEALVLYVKSLTLLARAMDIASVWWSNRTRSEPSTGVSAAVSQNVVQRINSVVQWVRSRFNEVLEKSEVVRLKLTEAQKQVPEDHPSHPSNQESSSISSSAGGSGVKQVFLTPGISAEKLMFERALEMSRAAAIDEVTNENLPGCELSYITAIRMLEAVLDGDENVPQKALESGKDTNKGAVAEIDSDEEHIKTLIAMITKRLVSVRKKLQMIAEANRAQQASPHLGHRRSGDVTPRSVPSS
ncbi:unnamed protein product [Clonostachys rhizophaga]|uniref:non-specific serine/threonine protein kinase n=1 Tax=Clonostachys rhizophaga TaxID=160324 RepID=A0A9N9VD43_9HYPO|nr:unnamed protein product [Clonostachys rhizophaga]